MPNQIAHFAIHADDVERAKVFYEEVFGWNIQPWGQPGFYVINAAAGPKGALHSRMNEERFSGFECTIAVEDLEKTAEAIKAAGGAIEMEKVQIPTVGWLLKFRDPEGNLVGAMKYDSPMH